MRIPQFYLTYVKDLKDIKNEAFHFTIDITSYLFENRIFYLDNQSILNILQEFKIKHENCKIIVYNQDLNKFVKFNNSFLCEIHSEYEEQELFLVIQKKRKIKNLQKQINSLKENIYELSTELNQFKENMMQNNFENNELYQLSKGNSQQNYLDVAIMYSEPLIVVNENGFKKAITDSINFRAEINNLKEIFDRSKKKINFKVEIATKENLIKILQEKPKVLHFICHGDYDKNNSKPFLGFEKANGELDHCTSLNLKTLMNALSKEAENLELVFVNACYSEQIGQVFQAAEIKSVICVQSEVKIEDEIAQQFSSHFYSSLIDNYSIKESFDRAISFLQGSKSDKEIYTCCCAHSHTSDCPWYMKLKDCNKGHSYHIPYCKCKKKQQQIHQKNCKFSNAFFNKFPGVETEENQKEASKHVQLEKDEVFVCCCSPHLPHNEALKFQILTASSLFVCLNIIENNLENENQCVFKELLEGELFQYNQFNNNFVLNCHIIGRNIEIQEIFSIFLQKKVITKCIEIYGQAGIGKTSLVKQAANYMNERKLFPDGIKYIDLNNIALMDSFTNKFMYIFQNQIKFREGDQSEDKFFELNKTAKKLYIFDNCDQLLEIKCTPFQQYFDNLNQNTENLKFIIILNKKKQLNLQNFVIKQIDYLKKEDCIELLNDLAGNYLPGAYCNQNLWKKHNLPNDIFDDKIIECRSPRKIHAIAKIFQENKISSFDEIINKIKQNLNNL